MVLQQAFHKTEEQRSLLFLPIFSLQYDPTPVQSIKLAVLNFCFYSDLIPFKNVSGHKQILCVWKTEVSCWTFSCCTHSERLYYLHTLSCSVTQKQKSLELKMGHLFSKDYSQHLQRIISCLGFMHYPAWNGNKVFVFQTAKSKKYAKINHWELKVSLQKLPYYMLVTNCTPNYDFHKVKGNSRMLQGLSLYLYLLCSLFRY